MDDEIVKILTSIAKIISADSGANEDVELRSLEEGIKPFAEKCQWGTGDTQLLKRALNYIKYTHGFPQTGATVHTYLSILEALMEVALPVALQDDETSVFLQDLAKGIEKATEDASRAR